MRHSTSVLARALALGLTVLLAGGLAGCALSENADTSQELIEPSIAPVPGEAPMDEVTGEANLADEGLSPEDRAGGTADETAISPQDRLVILTAGIRLGVDDVNESVDEIRSLATTYGGSITSSQISSDDDSPIYRYEAEGALADSAPLSGYVTVRVPSAAYEDFVDEVSELGDVLRQTESETDVTQEAIDLEARLQNLKAQELRLREFYAQAENVEELLALEQELTRVRAEIDSLQAQIDYYERQAAMSTVTVELAGPEPVVRPAGEDWGFVAAITQSIRAFVGTVNVMIVLAGAVLPIALIALAVFLVVRAIIVRRRAHMHDNPEAGQ